MHIGYPLAAAGWLDRNDEPILGAVPDLELVLRNVIEPMTPAGPFELDFQAPGRDPAAGVNATHDPPEVAFRLGGFLSRIAGSDADRSDGRCQVRIEPSRHTARSVMGAAVRTKADVDGDRLFPRFGDAEQVFDGVRDAAGVAERVATAFDGIIRRGDVDQNRGNLGVRTHPRVPRGNAGDMGAVRARLQLRLSLDVDRGRHTRPGRRHQRGVQLWF